MHSMDNMCDNTINIYTKIIFIILTEILFNIKLHIKVYIVYNR